MMEIQDIKNKIASPAYGFLRTDPHLGDKVILLGLGGSHAYGTAVEGSDLDIRGCALNTKEELLTGNRFEQRIDEATDTVIYSFSKLVSLLSNANPNTIELLGLEPEQYLLVTPIGQELLDNKKLFLSKKCVHSFGGYASQQLYRLQQREKHGMGQAQLEAHILKTLEFMRTDFSEKYSSIPEDELRLYIDRSEQEDMETEIYMDVRMTHYPLRDYCKLWNTLQETVKQYGRIGKRNSHAIDHGKMAKHMMHLARLYLMCFDILEKEEIRTCRKEEHDFLMEIRGGKYITDDLQVLPEFYEIIDGYEKRLAYDKENTSLPEKPDYKKIDEFVMSVNERVVLGKI